MVLGIGIDIIETARIAEKLQRSRGLMEKVFSPAEIEYCQRMAEPMQHFAGRFAAKEALIKALGFGLTGYLDLKDAAIANNELGAPYFVFAGEMSRIIQERSVGRVHVTISHIQLAACAVVVLEA
ncbi:holo-ACP synthase [Hymenobacter saemangeumensis]|uniref:Holo-[acyl-carrier-protein] synthase n=1 Tax=Hymenobacter saemangeumensis TaxID=1084522 RepID=A0ABP8ISV2_9BACT